jgi:hypothetical protein
MGLMRLADICLMASCLVLVAVVAKMLRAIRLLDGRVTLLQEQLSYSLTTGAKPAAKAGAKVPPVMPKADSSAASRPQRINTPIEGVPILPPASSAKRTPAPVPVTEEEFRYPGEEVPHVIGQAEADAVWARMEAEQERMRQAMGSDFRARQRTRSASDIRGTPVPVRKMTSQEIARKLEHK